MPDEDSIWTRAAAWVWSNWDTIGERLERLSRWFGKAHPSPSDPPPEPKPGILIIGPGGTGKTTLAKLLSGESYTRIFEEPWKYEESISEERYTLLDDPGVEIVVPPGQPHRRGTTWTDLRADLTAGKYRGVVLVVANGYHAMTTVGGVKSHPLYKGNRDQFVADFVTHQRGDELHVLQYLRPALESATGKLWLLVVVTKQDLWWPDRAAADAFYDSGPWRDTVSAVQAARGQRTFRHETVGVSLVISNYLSGEGELLAKNVAGYDQRQQVESLRRLFEVIDGLREWEGAS